MASNAYTKTNMDEVLRTLAAKGFENEVPRSALMRTIAEVTNLAHPLALKQFLTGMHEIALVEPKGAGGIWRIIGEDE